jgi:tetratricopeptide (TPR) repeat protein
VARALPILTSNGGPADRADARALAHAQRLLDAGQVAEARAVLVPLAADPATAVRAHAALLDAGLALMSGRAAEALATAQRVPAEPAFVLDQGYRAMVVASALRQLRRYPEAVAEASRAVAHGASAGRLLVLADAQKHAGLVAEAVRTLEQLLAAEPMHVTALAQLAGYLALAGRTADAAEARARFDAASSSSVETGDVARGRAFIALCARDLDAALSHLARALALEPDATRAYLVDEVELDPWRADERVRALV